MARGVLPDRGPILCLLHQRADSSLSQQGSAPLSFLILVAGSFSVFSGPSVEQVVNFVDFFFFPENQLLVSWLVSTVFLSSTSLVSFLTFIISLLLPTLEEFVLLSAS